MGLDNYVIDTLNGQRSDYVNKQTRVANWVTARAREDLESSERERERRALPVGSTQIDSFVVREIDKDVRRSRASFSFYRETIKLAVR